MLKSVVSSLLIYSLFIVSLSTPLMSQNQKPAPNATASKDDKADKSLDLKSVIAENERSYNAKAGNVDVKELAKIDRQQAQQKQGWTGKQKLVLAAIIVGIAALVFVVVKYGKNCIRSEPPGCSTATDDNCRCLEYEQNL